MGSGTPPVQTKIIIYAIVYFVENKMKYFISPSKSVDLACAIIGNCVISVSCDEIFASDTKKN